MIEPMSPVLILGAASDIGRALARRYADSGASMILAARSVDRLAADASDLRIRYKVPVSLVEFDATSPDPAAFFDRIDGTPRTVISVVGLLGDQARAETYHHVATLAMETNYVGPARVLNEAALRMDRSGGGCIIGISSVAGDRGRASNYMYGSAKAGFTAFLSGLRNRLAKRGIHVITVKPGYVDTRMTAGMKLPRLLTAQPDEVARHVFRAQVRKRDVIYVRPIWFFIMVVIRSIPEVIFKRLSL